MVGRSVLQGIAGLIWLRRDWTLCLSDVISVRRTVFQPWEVELLLDLESQLVDPKRAPAWLRRYERAVIRQLESGEGPPMKFSAYLQRSKTRRPSKE